MTQGIDLRDAFFNEIIPYLESNDHSIILVDDQGALALEQLRTRIPQRCLNIGIAEQNLIDVAGGLALESFHPFVYGITPFMSMRCLEQIHLHLGCMALPICIIGSGGAFTYSTDGPTHHALGDLAILRTIPNMTIFNPSDACATSFAAKQCISNKVPTYVRIEKGQYPELHAPDQEFKDGMALIDNGGETLVVTSGLAALEAAKAINELSGQQAVSQLDILRLKPLNIDQLARVLARFGRVVVVEEQSPNGGLFSLMCEARCKLERDISIIRMGPEDRAYFEYGSRAHLFARANIGSEQIRKVLDAR